MPAPERIQIGRWLIANGRFLLRRLQGAFTATVDLRENDSDALGEAGEKAAGRYLKSLGYKIIERGHLQRLGEIDLIAADGKTLVFVEVKTWRRANDADPSQAVTHSKQVKLTRTALTYLKSKKMLEARIRFDVVSIVWPEDSEPEIRHYKHAFEAANGPGLF